jgi:hypothetical protein
MGVRCGCAVCYTNRRMYVWILPCKFRKK